MFGSLVGKLTRLQSITLVLTIAAALSVLLQYATGSARTGEHLHYLFLSVTLFALVSLFSGRRGLLWRVRNRLWVTYFLFGIVPILLIGLMVIFSSEWLFGQLAADRVRQELDRRIEVARTAAHDIALTASYGKRTNAPTGALSGLMNELRQQMPGLRAVIRAGGQVLTIPADAELRDIPGWSAPNFKGLFEGGGARFIGARASSGPAVPGVFAYVPLDQQALVAFTPGVAVVSVVSGDARINVHIGSGNVRGRVLVRVGFGSTIYIDDKSGAKAKVESVRGDVLPPSKGFWDPALGWLLPWPMRTSSGEAESVYFTLVSRPSLLLADIGRGPVAYNFATALFILGAIFLLIELGSLIWSLRLTRTITRSVHDLYEGTRQVSAGNFSHRTPIRSKDQLSELAGSFNSMTEHIQRLIVEVRKKEKLESELEIAREVQTQLFPKAVPKLKTLELAGRCIPSRFVSGDYYDFVPLDDRWTSLALGDISGKGISAALLMASVQSALHAQLKSTGTMRAASSNDNALSTATLMGRLSQQLYENTPASKYATFFCSIYDDQTGNLLYTNAGHLPPILVRGGEASNLSGNGMVAGLFPNVSYEQHTIELQPGDLLAVFSDGIPEAENAAAEQFGEERLAEMLIQNADKPLDEIIRIVTDKVCAWADDPETQDDTTILLARRV